MTKNLNKDKAEEMVLKNKELSHFYSTVHLINHNENDKILQVFYVHTAAKNPKEADLLSLSYCHDNIALLNNEEFIISESSQLF